MPYRASTMPAMGLFYDFAYLGAATVSSPFWGFALLRTGKWRTDWAGRFGKVTMPDQFKSDSRPTILLHAVSVGEVNAIRQLVEQIDQQTDGAVRMVISVTTNTGIARAKQVFEPDHQVIRYPLDFSCSVRRVLNAVKPDVVGLVELEVWPNFMQQCQRRGVPVCVINGRLSERSFKAYKMGRPFLRPTFAKLATAAVQNQAYGERFEAMGMPGDRVVVTDTMKWDTAVIAEPDTVEGVDELAAALGLDRSRPLIVAGSTGPGEEELLVRTCPTDAQLVLVPRKPERFEEVARMLKQQAGHLIRRTECSDGSTRQVDADTRVFLLDTMGELRKAYALADVVLVGRSFVGLYGSDPIEPVALGKPAVIGTHHGDFADIVSAFTAGGGIEVSDQPGKLTEALLEDKQRATELAQCGREVIRCHQGATRRTADLLLKLLPVQENKDAPVIASVN